MNGTCTLAPADAVLRAQWRPMREPRAPAAPHASAPTDEALMLAYARGDVQAFAQLYERHEGGVFRFIRRCIAHQAGDGVAEELHQDTWFAVARQAAHYQPTARFTTWLYTIARSRVIDHVRRQQGAGGAMRSLDEDAEGGSPVQDLPAAEVHEPLRQLETREQARAFLHAVEQLPPEQREAFLLQAEAGLSLEEIAAATGVGAETVKSRLRYARAKLRQALAAWSS
ncbi:RNA polymerase ECF family sigma subunit [Caldimonas thermodepolymerans]|jgi:RNA polymerase sigma factor, sigma-70 family|uniref:RNA polymerase ECF family sigma subunit n=3 Tax=Caldimonas thermodepolymerans TaxID=215580 RepID=A0AA46DGC1_9BURK|nr:RNA polymerase ECF family sigma subunit [Caldimonas thermodepolymerans]TCP09565.1 RNA polymerase ECF family sigma subunit [Caldimonas thermodepolymerans]